MASLIDAEPIKKFIVDRLNSRNAMEAFGYDAIEILAQIEYAPTVDAVILPCKLGETVYVIRDCSCYARDSLIKGRTKCSQKVFLGKKQRAYHCGYVSEANFELKHIADFGKKVFLTREEAEAVLEERKCNDGGKR